MILGELPILYRVARRITLDTAEAEDLVGQTLLLAARAWGSFDGRYPRSWLIRILRNEHYHVRRRDAARPQTVPIDEAFCEPVDFSQEEEMDRAAAIEAILQRLDGLPEEYRLAVALCDVEGMTYQEAALAMEAPVGTVRSRLYRGRRMLRERVLAEVRANSVKQL